MRRVRGVARGAAGCGRTRRGEKTRRHASGHVLLSSRRSGRARRDAAEARGAAEARPTAPPPVPLRARQVPRRGHRTAARATHRRRLRRGGRMGRRERRRRWQRRWRGPEWGQGRRRRRRGRQGSERQRERPRRRRCHSCCAAWRATTASTASTASARARAATSIGGDSSPEPVRRRPSPPSTPRGSSSSGSKRQRLPALTARVAADRSREARNGQGWPDAPHRCGARGPGRWPQRSKIADRRCIPGPAGP